MKYLIALLIAGVAVTGIVVMRNNQSTNSSVNTPTQNANTANPAAANQNLNANRNPAAATESAAYAPLSTIDDAKALASAGRDVVLYFHADWCPICRPLDASLTANLASLPTDLTVLKVNYDTAADLKRQYGVTYQHTFVQIDGQGNKLKLWTGTSNALDIPGQII